MITMNSDSDFNSHLEHKFFDQSKSNIITAYSMFVHTSNPYDHRNRLEILRSLISRRKIYLTYPKKANPELLCSQSLKQNEIWVHEYKIPDDMNMKLRHILNAYYWHEMTSSIYSILTEYFWFDSSQVKQFQMTNIDSTILIVVDLYNDSEYHFMIFSTWSWS